VAAVLGVFLLVAGLAAALSPLLDTFNWKMMAAMLLFGLIGTWCTSVAWQLLTGRERPGGGLLSPMALIVIGAVCITGAIAEVLFLRSKGFNPAGLVGIALACFNMARSRWLARRHDREAA
jgi:hypothetical protein